jgi:hypothetical protein
MTRNRTRNIGDFEKAPRDVRVNILTGCYMMVYGTPEDASRKGAELGTD